MTQRRGRRWSATNAYLRPTSRGWVRIKSPDPAAYPEIKLNYLSTPEEFRPGVAAETDKDLEKAAGELGTTIFHPVGTCKMGSDPMAVVDDRLRVLGVDRLRVVDASIMPRITSGNTNAPTYLIAEKGAAMVLK